MGTLAVRLEVPVIKASKGLSPSSHFPIGFRLTVASASLWRYAPCLAHFPVGTLITERPPDRSVQAELPHTAPTSSVWRQTALEAKDEGSWV